MCIAAELSEMLFTYCVAKITVTTIRAIGMILCKIGQKALINIRMTTSDDY